MIDVTAAVIIENDRVFLARRPRGDRLEGFWEFPGGKIEDGESPEQCLVREILEEFGAKLSVGPLFMENVHAYDFGAVRLLFYHCRREDKNAPLSCNDHDEWRWVPLDQLKGLPLAPADLPAAEKLALGAMNVPEKEAAS